LAVLTATTFDGVLRETSEFSACISVVVSPPTAAPDTYFTTVSTPLNVAAPGVLGNDVDALGDLLFASLVTSPSHGTLTLAANGSFQYVPNPGFTGVDSFTYFATNGFLKSATVTVTINVSLTTLVPTLDAAGLVALGVGLCLVGALHLRR
jgi:titin